MSDWYSEAREADGRTDDEVMAEIRLRRDAGSVRCSVCGREFFSAAGRIPFHDPGDMACPGTTPPDDVTLRSAKPGCECKWGHRNDIAYHVESCPWRISRLAARR